MMRITGINLRSLRKRQKLGAQKRERVGKLGLPRALSLFQVFSYQIPLASVSPFASIDTSSCVTHATSLPVVHLEVQSIELE